MTNNIEELALQITALIAPLGPNMRTLAAEATTARTIRAAGSAFAGMVRIAGGEHILEDMTYGVNFARVSVNALRNAPGNNPYRGLSDEEIAGAILEKIETRRADQERARTVQAAPRGLLAPAPTNDGPGQLAPIPARSFFRFEVE